MIVGADRGQAWRCRVLLGDPEAVSRFRWPTLVPPEKQGDPERYEQEADGIERKYQRGALSRQERNDNLVEIWKEATEEVGKALRRSTIPPTTRSSRS